MDIIAIPGWSNTKGSDATWDIHKSRCRDTGAGTDYRGATYDDCRHFTAATRTEVTAECGTDVRYFPCTRPLRSN